MDVAIKWSLGEKLMSAVKLADPCLRVFANLLRIEVLVSAVQEILTMRCLHMMSEPLEMTHICVVLFDLQEATVAK